MTDLLTPIRQIHGCPDCRGHLLDSAGPEAAISEVGLPAEGRGFPPVPPAHLPEPDSED